MIRGGMRREHEPTFQTRSGLLRSGPEIGQLVNEMSAQRRVQERFVTPKRSGYLPSLLDIVVVVDNVSI